MAISLVQGRTTKNSGVSSINLAYSSDVTAGSLLVCAVNVRDGTSTITCTVSDDVDGAWTADVGPTRGGPSDETTYIFSLPNATGGTTTVTVNATASSYLKMYIYEFSGAATASHVDGTPVGTTGSSSVPNAGTITLTTNGVIVAVCANNTSGPSAGSGYTLDNADGNYWFCGNQHQIFASTGSKSSAFGGPSSTWVASAAGYKEAGAAGGTPRVASLGLMGVGI